MAARAAYDDFKTPAAQGFGDDRVSARPVEHKAVRDGILPARCGEDMAHAAQIALPLLSYVSDENEWQRMPDAHPPQPGRNSQQGGHASPVVGDAGAVYAASVDADV